MTTARTIIDLSKVPAPKVVAEIDYEVILNELITDFNLMAKPIGIRVKTNHEDDAKADILVVESDPIFKLLEVFAYREMLIRQRVNDGAKSCMLAYAVGDDLDNLAALYDVSRHTIAEATEDSAAILESDERFRRRVLLAMDSLGAAGSADSYLFHSLSASPDVQDAYVSSPSEGEVKIVIWSNEEASDGSASAELIEKVKSVVNGEEIRPLTDKVSVEGAVIVDLGLQLKIKVYDGVGGDEAINAVKESVIKQFEDSKQIGMKLPVSAIYSAAHISKVVEEVEIINASSSKMVEGNKVVKNSADGSIDLADNEAPGKVFDVQVNLEI